MMHDIHQVPIRTGNIRLAQLLKLANAVQDGAEAKNLIRDGRVMVNNTVETRRGRKLVPGDRVRLAEIVYEVVLRT